MGWLPGAHTSRDQGDPNPNPNPNSDWCGVLQAIGIHRLTEESHGNGGGMGLADIVSKKFFDAVDLDLTWKHLISANWVSGGKMPCCAGSDAEV